MSPPSHRTPIQTIPLRDGRTLQYGGAVGDIQPVRLDGSRIGTIEMTYAAWSVQRWSIRLPNGPLVYTSHQTQKAAANALRIAHDAARLAKVA